MKRQIMLCAFLVGFSSLPSMRAQETPAAAAERQEAEERYKRMSADIEDLKMTVQSYQQRLNEQREEIRKVNEEVARLNNKQDAATKDDFKHLAEKIKEVDDKRLADNEKLLEKVMAEFARLGKTLSPLPKTNPPSPVPPSTKPQVDPKPPTEKGLEYTIRSGDHPQVIVQALAKQGVKVTKKQIIERIQRLIGPSSVSGRKSSSRPRRHLEANIASQAMKAIGQRNLARFTPCFRSALARLAILLGMLWVNSGWGAAAAEREPPQTAMPDRVLELLLEANRTAQITNHPSRPSYGLATGKAIRQSAATNAAAFEILRQISWPDFPRMKRVRYHDRERGGAESNLVQGRWLFYSENNQLILLTDNFQKEWRMRDRTDLQDADYGAELAELLDVLRNGASSKPRQWSWNTVSFLPYKWAPATLPIFHHAVAAAWLGYTNEARALLQSAVNTEAASQTLWNHIEAQGQSSFTRGLTLLREGAPRSEVLKVWESTLRIFGPTLASTQLVDYVTMLKQQLEEFPKLAASTSENPELLPVPQRAAYYLDRFPDIKAGLYGEKTLEDAVVALGREAIPACVAHLADRRLTRLVGPHRRYSFIGPADHTTVLRVQDLALACVESITKMRFLDPKKGGPIFSSRRAEDRAQLVELVESWWRENADKSSTSWRLSRLQTLPLRERISEVRELERIDPTAADYLALLKSWAGQARGVEERELIHALVDRGDLSLLPRLREEWRRGRFEDVELLLRFGDAEDYGLLRDEERKRALKEPQRNFSLYAFRLPQALGTHRPQRPAVTNLLLVPLLTDALDYREPTTSRYLERNAKPCSVADVCLEALIQLTGHNEGYEPLAELAARNAAIDRWERWWTRGGETQWLTAHPETRPAFGTIEEEAPIVPIASLPELVRVVPADPDAKVTFELPRDQIPPLIQRGVVEGKEFAGLTQFGFTREANEFKTFCQAKAARFAKSAYTNRIGSARITVQRALQTSNAFLFPSIRFENIELAAPDAEGRTWLVQFGRTNTVAVYDGDRRTTLLSYTNEPYYAEPRPWPFAFPLNDGAMILVEGYGEKERVHLFDGKDHLQFASVESLVRHEARRLLKLLPSEPLPRGFGENALFHLAKDQQGYLWWVEARRFGVIAGTNNLVARREDFALGGETYFNFAWLMPLPRGAGVIAADHEHASVFTLEGNHLKPGPQAALPGASLRDTGSWWPRFVADRDGHFWVSSRSSVAFDSRAQRIGQQRGEVLLCDKDGGVWFVDYNHSLDIALVRLARDGTTAQLRLPGINGPPCLCADATVWVLTQRGLVQVAYKRGKLEPIAEAPVSFANDACYWCDAHDRLWIAGLGAPSSRAKVVCLNTRR